MHTVPQLIYLLRDRHGVLVVAKIVGDVLATGEDDNLKQFVKKFDTKFKLGTLSRTSGMLCYFALNIVQHGDMNISVDVRDKKAAIEPFPITCLRRWQVIEPVNSLEVQAFCSVCSYIAWLGVNISPVCEYSHSHMQQRMPNATLKTLIEQINALRLLKNSGYSLTMFDQQQVITKSLKFPTRMQIVTMMLRSNRL